LGHKSVAVSVGRALVNGRECRGVAIFVPGDTTVKFLALPLPPLSEAHWITVDLASYVAESVPQNEWVVHAQGVIERWYSIEPDS
jgi:hypothetical protein